MPSVRLSFCIPTYNRAASVVGLVKSILSCGLNTIEVVVLDNGSTDDTLARLQSIQDSRLVVRSNGRNMGALYNALNVLNMAQGEYVVFSIDKDGVNPEKIGAFQRYLSACANAACGYCEFNSPKAGGIEVWEKGFAALRRIAYGGRHPTGYFYRRKYLQEIGILQKFSDPDKVGVFSFDLMLAELCLKGDGVVFHDPVFTQETHAMAARQKSYNIDGNSKDAFYSPHGRLKTAVNYVRHIDGLSLPIAQSSLLVSDVFLRGIALATGGYRALLANPDLCVHYRLEVRAVRPLEILKTGVWYYAVFNAAVWRTLRWGRLDKIKLHALILQRAIVKCMQKRWTLFG